MARDTRKFVINFITLVFCFLISHVFCSYSSLLLHLIDNHRKEFYTQDSHHPWRELMVRIWYPDNQQHCPMLLFSHGLGGSFNGDSYQSLCRACVDAGYVVVTISHSYACKPVRFSDGRITKYELVNVAKRYNTGHELREWCADIAYVLDQCCALTYDAHSFLYNKIDVNKIGIMGHSFGGAAAIAMCRKDNRIKAAINVDGPLCGNNAMVPFCKPLLFIIGSQLPYSIQLITHPLLANDIAWSQRMHSQEIFAINALISSMKNYASKIIIDGVRHTTFSDEIFMQQTFFDASLLDPYAAHDIINTYVIDFFNMFVKK